MTTPLAMRQWRKRMGFNQKAAARALDRHRRTIQSYESSEELPLIAALAAAAIENGIEPIAEEDSN
jgi:DNA-binding XRE family transcriptional regulator